MTKYSIIIHTYTHLPSAGMFPYVCLATMPLFCRVDWPRKLLEARTHRREKFNGESCSSRKSRDYFFKDNDGQSDVADVQDKANDGMRNKKRRVSRKQKLVVAMLLLHVGLQFFLPYSHFVTKV